MEQPYLRAFEAQCTQEEPPGCQTMCPLHVEARAFTGLMAQGKFADARKMLDRTMPLSCLMGCLCDGACLNDCRRSAVDSPVNLPLLERACVSLTRSAKPMALPATNKAIAVIGAGLSSLAAAWELGKKGHKVTVWHTGPVGGRLLELDERVLPQTALPEALEQLAAVRVAFAGLPAYSPDWLKDLLSQVEAVYLGLDDEDVRTCDSWSSHGLSVKDGKLVHAPLTLETSDPRIFAGGASGEAGPSFVLEAADGKRAAGSITRLLQKVSPATAREHEEIYPTALFTDVSGVGPVPQVVPAEPFRPTEDEALNEAARCIQCQCLECVKRCGYLAHYKGYPKKYAREIYNNLAMVHGVRRANTQIDSCALCGLCAAVCPNNADMGAFCFTAKREMVHVRRMPVSAHEFALEDMAYSNAPDIAFFRHQPGKDKSAWAFFPGCQLPASLPLPTERLYAYLCDQLGTRNGNGADGGVGLFFHCCGAPAKWSGREILTRDSAQAVRVQWEEAGKPALILACASCAAFFAAELPDIPARSLWDVLADLPLPQGAAAVAETLALHDPCAARDAPATRESVRGILQSLKQDVEELPLGREMTRCCGYGGLAAAANPAMGDVYALERAGDTDKAILAWCIMCRDRLAAVGKPALHLLDILFGTDAAGAAARPAPGISVRQENRRAFRQTLLQTLWHEIPVRNPRMDAITLHFSDEVARKLEARRILRSDIKSVLMHAEDNGAQFFNAGTGRYLTSLRPKQVTFWVEYSREADGCYTIHDAYCHRMVVPGTPGEGLPTAVIREGHDPAGGRV